MAKKWETYAEHQYKRAYSLLREAWNNAPFSEGRHQCFEELDMSIEDSYYFAANRSHVLRSKRMDVGIAFWAQRYNSIRWHQQNLSLAAKVHDHFNEWFLSK